jgi:ArsR family transcriptional regulator, arsenate/arsenite/antimonite-responsive transcriptional repressor
MGGMPVPPLDPACAQALAKHLRPGLFKALSDPRRLGLLARLAVATEPMTVTEATSCCGVHVSGASRHLAALRDAGVLHAERRGREVAYRVDFPALVGALRGLADALEACARETGCCTFEEARGETTP